MTEIERQLATVAQQVAEALQKRGMKLVLTESCTGGLVASTLTAIPGISQYFCGSAVTYRDETKASWLQVSRSDLANPKIGAVSPHVAEQMCQGALAQTPEADLAGSTTGHLGPNAPAEFDGVVFVGIALRSGTSVTVQRRTVSKQAPAGWTLRNYRRYEAAILVLQAVLKALA
ncbi:nicotinamide-nucleotide amidase/nicotinamide-nucleotide amidase [Planctomicrobium piriforme]|uniref:Nicotinamide-nucleotide amidase/nicotinamide-nucleotide amidase n=2 Tax=Planctomicrobium piriforme TaxID=1576369 RepID=A0A1I3QQJ1_9PLAN|nr:nicotinamide-nucleotide amidase/nicotinamide-nucleotide amidase [Planctomicrobium piriforme]